MTGVEPATPWMQIRCSPNWATSPRRFATFQISNFKFEIGPEQNGCGDRIWTCDLWVMSPTSYLTAPPRDNFINISNFKFEIWNHRQLRCWWAWVDSNYRPHAYQACALTNWATGPWALHERQADLSLNPGSRIRFTIQNPKSEIQNRQGLPDKNYIKRTM